MNLRETRHTENAKLVSQRIGCVEGHWSGPDTSVGGGGARSVGWSCRVTMASAFLWAPVGWAGEGEPPVDSGQERIEANRSIVLDPSAPPALAPNAERETGARHKGADLQGDGDIDGAPAGTSATAASGSRLARSPKLVKPRRRDMDFAVMGEQATPWYRTGLGALAIVLVAVGVVYFLVRRWIPGVGSAEGGAVCVVGRTALTPKHSATLIRLGRRFVLVGISPDRVQTLCEVSDPEEVAELAARAGAATSPGGKVFDQLLASEAAEYRPEAEEAADTPRPKTPPPTRRSGPLNDLLKKLRVLSAADVSP